MQILRIYRAAWALDTGPPLSSTDLVFLSLILVMASLASTLSALDRFPRLGSSRSSLPGPAAFSAATGNGATKYFSSPVNIFPTYDRFERVPLGDGPPGVGEHLGPVLQLRPGRAAANLHTP